jgi:colanic acid/amylovoran biosynthesis glycosyltransferase
VEARRTADLDRTSTPGGTATTHPVERPGVVHDDTAPVPPVAFLVSAYPALSHAFIEREVVALRAAGVQVETFTVRGPDADAALSAVSRAEAERTTALLGQPPAAYAGALLELVRTRPTALLRGLATAWTSGPRTARAKLWQHFYLVEAALLVQHLRRRGVRHVHVHFANNGADVARLAVALGRAVDGAGAGWRWTFSMHGPTEFTDPVGHDLAAKVRSADAVACISDYCRDELGALVGAGETDHLGLVRMGVDVTRFAPAAERRAARAPGPLRLLFVGRLVPEKGPSDLLAAVARLRAAGRDLDVVVVGNGPLREQLAAEVAAQGLQDVVRLLGPVGQDDLPAWYEWADVFCLPSYAEGVPVVLMEAMATQLPVVTTRIAGIPELVRDGDTGLLVEPGRPELVAAAVERLAAAPAERAELGRRARRRIVEEFQPAENAERLVALWRRTAARGAAGPA